VLIDHPGSDWKPVGSDYGGIHHSHADAGAVAAKGGYTGTTQWPQRKCDLVLRDMTRKDVARKDEQPSRTSGDTSGNTDMRNTMSDHLADWLADLRVALAFFTRLPLAGPADHGLPDFSRAARATPLAGALVGLIGGIALAILIGLGIAPLAAALAAIGLMILITGGLHEDGLADTADGLGAFDREKRLAIMRDSRIGSYGVLALIIAIGTKAALLAQIAEQSGVLAGAAALIAAEGLSRLTALYPLHALSPARSDGLSHSAFAPTASAMVQGAAVGGAITLLAVGFTIGLLGFLIAAITAIALALAGTRWADHMLGGHTGDIAGAVQQVTALGMLAAVAVAGA
jgi:adenosylcobinamide-GDP ribazoletransferase